MSEDIAIKIEDVSKNFKLPHERVDSVKSLFVNPFKSKKGLQTETQRALKDIGFEIKKGEFFGIVGRNGSGKSTLLKIIAGIYQPTEGTIEVNGRLVPFIELGVGFNPDLTGRENVYLNGALMGFSTKEVDAKYDSIVDFAELERFMDQKLKNYSSGMQVRLAFSVATILADSDILLIDEVLAVGDADFQRKCFNYFKKLKRDKKTVIFVSHDMSAVREYCDRAALIDNSELVKVDEPGVIAEYYDKLFTSAHVNSQHSSQYNRWGSGEIITTSVDVYGTDKRNISFKTVIRASSQVFNPIVGFRVRNAAGKEILGTNTKIEGKKLGTIGQQEEMHVTWKMPNIFSDGEYSLDLAIILEDGITTTDWWDDAVSFTVKKRWMPYDIDLQYVCEYGNSK